jgi:hypothetical protein
VTSEHAIRRAVLDYFEGWFEGDADRMERALHPQLAKRSLEKDDLETLSAKSMIDATARGNGTRWPPDRRAIEIEIVDVHGSIANVVVRGSIYREYIQLAQTDEGWKIVNTLWDFV